MRLILIRHGQTPCNITDIWHGWDDCGLTDLGVSQALAVSVRLAGEPITAIHCSDLRRAVETAQIVAEPHGLKPVLDFAFRERNAGDFQGSTFDDVVTRNPAVLKERAADYWSWAPPNGESFHAVLARGLEGIDRLREAYPSETVALVGHMGTVRVLVSHFLKIPIAKTYEMEFVSTGVTILDLVDGTVLVQLLDDGAHLEASAAQH